MEQTPFVIAAAIVIGAIACVFDLRTRRIPNLLTFGSAAAALTYHGITGGLPGALGSAGGWVVGVLLFAPLFLLGGMGGGDVKLLAALGAWLGPWSSLWVGVFSTLAGGVLAVVVALHAGYLRQAVRNIWLLLMHWRASGLRPLPGVTLDTAGGPRLAYAVPILTGLVITLWRS
jgi:prepilin peptidase CpaA